MVAGPAAASPAFAGQVDSPTSASYSLAERDFRWEAIRREAAAADLDCVVVPPVVDEQTVFVDLEPIHADASFVTLIRDAAAVVPTDGRPPVVLASSGSANHWVPEPRSVPTSPGGAPDWGAALACVLRDLGLGSAVVGISSFRRGVLANARVTNGVASAAACGELVTQLPDATFVDATDLLGRARFVKSAEQIECLRRGVRFAEAGIDEVVRTARPGVPMRTVYARAMRRVLSEGSEYYGLGWMAGPLDGWATRYDDPSPNQVLELDTRVDLEVVGICGGLVAQEAQPVFVGRKVPEALRPLIEVHAELFAASLALMKPGVPLRDLVRAVREFGGARGVVTECYLHGRGHGGDGPTMSPAALDAENVLTIEEGNAFVFKPGVFSADGASSRFTWGGVVLVTSTGGQALFERSHGLVCVA